MLICPHSLTHTNSSIFILEDYKSISDEDFLKTVKLILFYHKEEFGINKTYTDYLSKYARKELKYKEEVLSEMKNFAELLLIKSLV